MDEDGFCDEDLFLMEDENAKEPRQHINWSIKNTLNWQFESSLIPD